VEQRESYRVQAKRIWEKSGRKIGPTTVNHMVLEIALRCKSAREMSEELRPHWEGYLLVDEKMVSVRGGRRWYYHGVDSTGEIAHSRSVTELSSTQARRFFEEITEDLSYPLRGIITDFDSSLTSAVERRYPEIPHQLCLKHAFAILERTIGYTPYAQRREWNRTTLRSDFEKLRDKRGIWVEKARGEFMESYRAHEPLAGKHQRLWELLQELRGILFASSRALAERRLTDLRRRRLSSSVTQEKRRAIRFLDRFWEKLMTYHAHKGMPRTTNLVESVNKQIERRMKSIEGFQSGKNADAYMNLLIAYLRQKPYTDCRGERKKCNGKSRLECAGVKLGSSDWLQYAISK
jgi:transposase-like protein